ncbi:hypothetical protein EDB80DRAFT_880831 [Ilyonectria destructans]|nr:hypothetical protein EDB80DRAFT_880831 [Ilyonectria destructans]
MVKQIFRDIPMKKELDMHVCIHSATLDNMEYRRHFIRITALADIPIQAKYTPPTNEDMYAK